MVASVAKRALETLDLTLVVEPSLTQRLLAEGSSRRFGARPLRRTVQRLVEDVVAVAILEGFVGAGDTVTLGATAGSGEGSANSDYDFKTVAVARAASGDRPAAVVEVPVSLSIGIEDSEDDEIGATAPPALPPPSPPPANNIAPAAFTPEALASVAPAN